MSQDKESPFNIYFSYLEDCSKQASKHIGRCRLVSLASCVFCDFCVRRISTTGMFSYASRNEQVFSINTADAIRSAQMCLNLRFVRQ